MNKVQKIREEVEKIAKSINPFIPDEDGKNSDYEAGKLDAATQILQIIDSLEEPVSNPIDFEKELYKAFGQVKDFTLGMRIAKRFYDMGKKSREPVSEDLEEAADKYCNNICNIVEFTEGDSEEEASDREYVERAFKAGALWQKKHLWKDAQGDDLPEIDREVIALVAYDFGHYKVVYAHRPNPNGWDGKNLITGKVEHYTPKTYGKGGWNIPNIIYWLDVDLPKEIEL